MASPKRQVLDVLARTTLLAIADSEGIDLPERRALEPIRDALSRKRTLSMETILGHLDRAELKSCCRALGLDETGTAKEALAQRILEATEGPHTVAPERQPPVPRPSAGSQPLPVGGKPTVTGVLQPLSKARLVEVGRYFGLAIPPDATKEAQVELLTAKVGFRDVLRALGRDDLKNACRACGLDDAGRARTALAERLLTAHGDGNGHGVEPIFAEHRRSPDQLPRVGDVVQVRHRQYLVEEVTPPPEPKHATLVELVCLDDDNQGRELAVLWELELGARVLQPEAHGLGKVSKIDAPRFFAAYLHALKWSSVTATDARLFQAPFRAGIKLMQHQLTPLRKALELPRANLFIADDVGLGKTIEAGLVLQELTLRQRVELTLIVCPASVALQWRDEMAKRFGLHFEIVNRTFVGLRRQQRGFGVNPWSTHNRFIVSYQTLRRPEYLEPLTQHLGLRARKSLLILDEAHTVAPASDRKLAKYAIDSRLTKMVRHELAPRFENRLFLSATPHNGHSNSFSALLELLDPQRFTRGVDVTPSHLTAVMVRRLKSDLRGINEGNYPDRHILRLDLQHDASGWRATYLQQEGEAAREVHRTTLGQGQPIELTLAKLLAEYTKLMKPEKGQGQLPFINLQKRLLSSVEAFHRTLRCHHQGVATGKARTALQIKKVEPDEDEYGIDDEQQDEADDAETEKASREVATPEGRARQILDDMLRLSDQHRSAPDAKVLTLIDWIRQHQCPAVQVGGARERDPARRRWSNRRVIVFTEYGDTKRYLWNLLKAAVEGTDQDEQRLMQFHGGMSDVQREEVQRAFNGDPTENPVRILIATDAAREGVNLQGYCADLFHFDLPWNPARMEQRNGRIDRTLQPEPVVRCHYFNYVDRPEDAVLRKLAAKVDTILRELGSLGTVVMDRMAKVLDRGIDTRTVGDLDDVEEPRNREVAEKELESQRADRQRLRQEIDEVGRILNRSREVVEFDNRLLRDAIDVGLELAGAEPMKLLSGDGAGNRAVYCLPSLPSAWDATLDTLRPPRPRDEPFWEWRRRPPEPVAFEASDRVDSTHVHLHLQHPFVQRVMSRFRAQGYSAHDLNRVTIVKNRRDALVRVIAFGRLSLFGAGATRLHDQLVSVAAQWLEAGGPKHLRPFAEEADREAVRRLEEILAESPTLDGIGPRTQERLARAAPDDFATLWQHIKQEAESQAHDSELKLKTRGAAEADALRAILRAQRASIDKTIKERSQAELAFSEADKAAREQWEQDLKHMQERREQIAKELATEPDQIEGLYHVVLRRLEPVGLVYLWPETRS